VRWANRKIYQQRQHFLHGNVSPCPGPRPRRPQSAASSVGTQLALSKVTSASDATVFDKLQEAAMNWDRVQGNWKQLKGMVQQKWGKLTDDQFAAIDGQREILAGKLQEAYGIGKEEAERQIRDLEDSVREASNDREPSARINARR